MKRNVIITVLIVVCLLTTVICKIVKINLLYPERKENYINVGKEGLMGNDITLRVLNSRNLTQKEFIQIYSENSDIKQTEESKVFIVTVQIKNQNKEKVIANIYDIYIEKTGYCNGILRDTFFLLNADIDMEIELLPGEEINVELPFLLNEYQFSVDEWDNLSKDDFYLVVQRYPIKTCWNIDKE